MSIIWTCLFGFACFTHKIKAFLFFEALQLSAQADGLALDGDGIHILADAQDSRKCGVFRPQFAAVTPVFQIP